LWYRSQFHAFPLASAGLTEAGNCLSSINVSVGLKSVTMVELLHHSHAGHCLFSEVYKGTSKSFWTELITKYTLTTINNCWEATQRVIVANLTRLTHKIVIQLHLVAESCTIFSYCSRWPVRKLLDSPSYLIYAFSGVGSSPALGCLGCQYNDKPVTQRWEYWNVMYFRCSLDSGQCSPA